MGDLAAPSGAIDVIELSDNRTMVVRAATADDAAAICALYRDLPMADRRRRFFGSFLPREAWCREWATVGDRGGFAVVALVDGAVIGEAGYAPRDDGDGDLAVTIAPDWRGWLGPYLLDVLVRHAAEQGVRSLQAEVLLENGPMLSLLCHRDPVALEHDDGVVRLSIGTTGPSPAWPPEEHRRKVLVEVPGRRWSGEHAAESADLAVAMCAGPAARHRHGCPVLTGGTCDLADHADAIVVLLDPDDEVGHRLVEAHRGNTPGTPVFVRHSANREGPPDIGGCLELEGDGTAVVDQILSVIATPTGER
jgi:L-amino acid N-acyltransferase YncA